MEKGILILTRTLGDCVVGNTLAVELKRRYSALKLSYAIELQYAEIVRNNPAVDNVVEVNEWIELLKCLKDYDKIFMAQQNQHTDTMWHHSTKYYDLHLLDFYALRIGIETAERKLYMFPTGQDRKKASELLPKEKPIIVIHTTTPTDAKNWVIERFKRIAFLLAEEENEIVQVGAGTDNALDSPKHFSYLDLRGRLSINETAAVIERANLFIGLDSGISFISAAMNTPTICIFGTVYSLTTGPFGNSVFHICSPTSCRPIPCHTHCTTGRKCINDIKIEEVYEKAKMVLKQFSGKVINS